MHGRVTSAATWAHRGSDSTKAISVARSVEISKVIASVFIDPRQRVRVCVGEGNAMASVKCIEDMQERGGARRDDLEVGGQSRRSREKQVRWVETNQTIPVAPYCLPPP